MRLIMVEIDYAVMIKEREFIQFSRERGLKGLMGGKGQCYNFEGFIGR